MEDKIGKAKEIAELFLHQELGDTKFSPIIVLHPFFESAFVSDDDGIFNAMEDAERFNKLKVMFYKKVILPCETLSDLLFVIRKSYRLTFIHYLHKANIISLKECGNLLAECWSGIENHNNDVNVSKRTILSWLKHADKDKLMDEEDMKKYDKLIDEVIIYRGCANKKATNGFGWTINKEVGKWFANRFGSGYLYSAKIKKEHIFAYINERSEQEVIVDYRQIYDVELLSK